jgi:hypothetical protein
MIYNLSQETTALCCSAEKLQLIYAEIEKRKTDILIGLSLAKFQEQHPGMEHFAGVHQGDTFLLVYVRDAMNGIGANTVVADFTLPYLCCSDCRPVGFIMPEIITDLRLGSNSLCVSQGATQLIRMYRYPADGVVEVSPTIPGVYADGENLVINSTMIPESAYEQVIHFTLNGHPTNAELTLHKVPVATMIVPPSPITSPDVNFSCALQTGADPNAYTYFWDFGDGATSLEQTPIHTYETPITVATVRLTISSIVNNICPLTLEQTLAFNIPSPSNCETQSSEYFVALQAQFDIITAENDMTEEVIEDMRNFYSEVNSNMEDFLSGKNNSITGGIIQSLSINLFNEIMTAHSEGQNTEPLVSVYHNSMRLGLTLVRCQTETIFNDNRIIDMLRAFTSQMDFNTEPSLPSMGIQSNTEENISFLNEVLMLREPGSVSWQNVNSLLNVVSWQ